MNPILLDLGMIQIHWYSFLMATALIIGGYLVLREAKKHGISEDTMIDFFFLLLPISFIGARLYFVLFHLPEYMNYPLDIFKVWEGGLAIHGGLFAGLAYLIYFAKKHKIPSFLLTDMLVVSLLLGQAIGRWGNFMNGEAYGPVTTLTFLKDLHLPNFIIEGMKIDGIYHQPTFLYESIWCFIGFLLILLIRKYAKLKMGTLTGLYMTWYGFERFFVEQLRTDSLMLGNFKIAQIVSLLFVITGVILVIYSTKKNKNYHMEVNNGK